MGRFIAVGRLSEVGGEEAGIQAEQYISEGTGMK